MQYISCNDGQNRCAGCGCQSKPGKERKSVLERGRLRGGPFVDGFGAGEEFLDDLGAVGLLFDHDTDFIAEPYGVGHARAHDARGGRFILDDDAVFLRRRGIEHRVADGGPDAEFVDTHGVGIFRRGSAGEEGAEEIFGCGFLAFAVEVAEHRDGKIGEEVDVLQIVAVEENDLAVDGHGIAGDLDALEGEFNFLIGCRREPRAEDERGFDHLARAGKALGLHHHVGPADRLGLEKFARALALGGKQMILHALAVRVGEGHDGHGHNARRSGDGENEFEKWAHVMIRITGLRGGSLDDQRKNEAPLVYNQRCPYPIKRR